LFLKSLLFLTELILTIPGIKDVIINELAMPVCGENDIIVKNLYASICGSDIRDYYHRGDAVRVFKGFEFGHEMVSE